MGGGRARDGAALATIVMAAGTMLFACGPSGGGDRCEEDPPGEPRCCDPDLYVAVSVPALLGDPGPYFGNYIETGGTADWYNSDWIGPECICVEGICTCVTPLGLRSEACGSIVRLTGIYRGRPVECSDMGCWPLLILSRYAVCGIWQPSDAPGFGEAGVVEVQAFCDR